MRIFGSGMPWSTKVACFALTEFRRATNCFGRHSGGTCRWRVGVKVTLLQGLCTNENSLLGSYDGRVIECTT